MLKILHIIIDLNVGGAELMLKRLIESHNKKSEYEHLIISLTDKGRIGSQLIEQGISVYSLGMRHPLDIPRILFKLIKLIHNLKPDIVQTWMYHADLLGGLAAKFSGQKNIIWGIRSTDIRKGGSKVTILIRRICAILSRSIPSVIVCAAEASRRIHIHLGYDQKRMIVIPNGFEMHRLYATLEEREAIRSTYGILPNEVVVGSLGRFSPVKDHASFIAAAGILSACSTNLKFLMVGRGLDPANIDLMQMILATNYPDRFILLGERNDVAACLKAMDIFCLHSSTEGFPNVLGEAMAMGLPCVTTDVGDAAYLLGDSGIVVPSHNPRALADGLQEIIELDQAKRTALGLCAKARIKDEFTMSMTSQRFSQVYRSLIDNTV